MSDLSEAEIGPPAPNLAARLARIDRLESELARKAAGLVGRGAQLGHADFFIFGALRRTLAQARGFRDLIVARNFPCAAAILRLQIDTAMRVNALSLVEDQDATCKAVLDGERFNRLKDASGRKMSDAFLREQLEKEHPWIAPVYERTSGFIHLSGQHWEMTIARTEENDRLAYFQIGGHDPERPEEVYFEAVDTFFEATRLAGLLILTCLAARHHAGELTASESR